MVALPAMGSLTALDFIQDLLGAGRVRVDASPAAPDQLSNAVLALEQLTRPAMAFAPPPLLRAAGEWAVLRIYRACQALVYREIEGDIVRAALAAPCPAPAGPAACYAVDLAFCVLPE